MKLTIWLLVFGLLGVVACDIAIPLPTVEAEQVIVANSFFRPDSIWQVQLTKSFALYESDKIEFINNAFVEILDKNTGSAITLHHHQNGLYMADQSYPLQNTNYLLSVEAMDLPPIQSSNAIPSSFNVNIKTHQFSEIRNLPSFLYKIELVDNPAEKNFYLIEVTYLLTIQDNLHTQKAGHFSFDPNSDNETVEIDHTNLRQSYLSDLHFNGETYLTEVGANSLLLRRLTEASNATAIIRIKSTSYEGYEHAKTTEELENGGSFSSPEPIKVFSNIEGGFGLFAGFTEQRFEITLK